ncbi:MAG TPA: phosphopantetheine-binding protein [Pyrinomonadaceae bacterium]|nr:hypothetical protein [Chloracidobacterium sp.]MBP9935146.1 hypothetical protein [Pyrinomonadaceae bacterium]MBK7803427.1 hypothetical protein [Chloracidobacterium sp.]MBK9766734.1 hypothetical protein [Chloracidobacterium sp.]MBL0241203.1 hypothetical protein [Chloracidobacterium sp.]
MGLELVELVMRIEEEFDIAIPNEAAEKMTTPRKVIDYVASQPNVSKQWSRGYVEVTIWLSIEDELGIKREDFNDDSLFIQDMGAD